MDYYGTFSFNRFIQFEYMVSGNVDCTLELTHCVIIGLGLTGLSCVKFLLQYDLDIVVMDTREFPASLSMFEKEHPKIPIKTGG